MLSKNNNKKRFKEKTQQQDNPPKFSPIRQSLSLFVSFAESFSYDLFTKSSPTSKSPRKSFDDGAVGLGIVAAMIDSAATKPAVSFRSDPVPIFSARAAAAKLGRPIWKEDEEMEMELSETYTRVISHVGGKSVRKRVYYDDGYDDIGAGKIKSEPVVLFFNSPPPVKPAPPLPADDFLSCCYLCKKKLHGMDIFMYRGEKPFCSPECRSQHILRNEHWEKRASEALTPFDCAGSPCSAHPLFSAGIAAA